MADPNLQSTLRADIAAALHKERTRLDACQEAATNAMKESFEARHSLLTEYVDLLENEDMNVVLKIEPEYQHGRIRL